MVYTPQVYTETPGDPSSLVTAQKLNNSEQGIKAAHDIAAAKADLVNGVIPDNQIPSLALQDTFVVSSQASMLALNAQRGDIAIRDDLTPPVTYRLVSGAASTLANWREIPTAGGVITWAGKTGRILPAINDITGLSTELAAKADLGTDGFVKPEQIPNLNANVTVGAMAGALEGQGLLLQSQFLQALGASDAATRALMAGILGFLLSPDVGKIIVNRDFTSANYQTQTRPYGTDTNKIIVRWRATDGNTFTPTNYIAGNDEIRIISA